MKKLLISLIALLLPVSAFAVTTVPWQQTNLNDGFIFPTKVNGNVQGIIVSASSSLQNFTFTTATGTSATTTNFFATNSSSTNLFTNQPNGCVQITNGKLLSIGSSCGTGGGTVTSVADDGRATLTISPTTGIVLAGLNLANANTWSALQTFGNILVTGSSTLQNFTGLNSTTTNATSTTSFATTASSSKLFTANFNGANLTSCTGTNAVTWSAGLFGCTAIPQGTVTSVTGTWPITSSGGTTPNITWSGLASSTNLVSSDLLYSTGVNTYGQVATSTLTASSPLTGSFVQIGSGGSLGCQTASGSQAGCLSSADWTTFNGKGSGSVTSVATNNGITGGTITTTGTLSLDQTFGAIWTTASTTFVNGVTMGRSTTTSATTTNLFSTTASSTNLFSTNSNIGATTITTLAGAGLTNCNSASNALTWTSSSGLFGCNTITGGSGGVSPWSTTTSSVTGELINFSNNTTDIVTVGGNATTSAKFYLDPNTTTASFGTGATNIQFVGNANSYITNNLGIGTTTPYARLTVFGTSTGAENAFEVANSASTTKFSVKDNGLVTLTNLMSLGSSTLQNYTFTTSTGTAATTTNLFATTASTTNLFVGTGAGCAQINSSGQLTVIAGTCLVANQTITLSGDVTGSGATSIATTLATVNGNVGSFGGANSIPNFTVNAKGLITAAGASTPSIPASEVTSGIFGTGNYVFPAQLQVNSSTTLQNFTGLQSTTTNATTTSLAISSIASGNCLQTSTGGAVIGSGSACGSGGGGAYPFQLTGNATSTLTQFNGGLTSYASTTIGGGTNLTGLTISGPSTTTGNVLATGTYFRFGNSAPNFPCQEAVCMEVGGSDNSTAGTGYNAYNTNSGTSAYTGYTLSNDKANSNITNFAGGYLNSSTYSDTTFGTAFAIPYLYGIQNSMGAMSLFASTSTSPSNAYIDLFTSGTTAGAANVGGNERMRIDGVGRVGIGTTTPQYLLEIATTTRPQFVIDDPSGGTNAKHGGIGFNNGTFTFGTTSDTVFTSTSTAMSLTAGVPASLNVGTSTDSSRIGVQGVSGNGTLLFNLSNFAGTSVFSIDGNGNLIGQNATVTNATTTSFFATTASTSKLFLTTGTGCLQSTAGLVSGTGVACGSGSGGGNSKFATTTSTLNPNAITPNGGISTLLGLGTSTPAFQLEVASTSNPQIVIDDLNGGVNAKHGAFGFTNGMFTFGTTSDTVFTSTSSAITFNLNASVPSFEIGSTSPYGILTAVRKSGTNPLFLVASSSVVGSAIPNFEIDPNGHIITSGPKPTLSSCGTSPSITGNDEDMIVTVGSVSATGCTVTFANTYGTAPVVTFNNQSMSITSALTYTVSETAITFSQATGLTGDVLDIHVHGTQ